MPTVAFAGNVPANGQVDLMTQPNGVQYQYPGPRGNVYAVYAGQTTVGLVLDVKFGTKILAEGTPLTTLGVGIQPSTDSDLRVREAAMPNERVQVVLRNPTGAILIGQALVDIT